MLIDIELTKPDLMALILTAVSRGTSGPERSLFKGIFLTPHWNFEWYLPGGEDAWEKYPDLSKFPLPNPKEAWEVWNSYGVCDSPEQFMLSLGKHLKRAKRQFVVAMVCLKKSDEPSEGGWRWEKWGPYIGKQEPQAVYLVDEPEIEQVYTYHVYERKP